MNRRTSLAMVTGLAGSLALEAGTAFAAKGGGGGGSQLAAAATGTIVDALNNVVGQFAGTLTIEQFSAQGGNLVAIGTLTGKLTNLLGELIDVARSVPVTLIGNVTQATCTILTLELGPLDLNLLGLMVHLDKIVLTITAVPGGGLLGDLLCAIANLLQGGGLLADLVDLLNELLDLFGSV
jgi:hypothetical protein